MVLSALRRVDLEKMSAWARGQAGQLAGKSAAQDAWSGVGGPTAWLPGVTGLGPEGSLKYGPSRGFLLPKSKEGTEDEVYVLE